MAPVVTCVDLVYTCHRGKKKMMHSKYKKKNMKLISLQVVFIGHIGDIGIYYGSRNKGRGNVHGSACKPA
jgi:hypothetical protein